jgi:hypothetical protein
LDEHFKWVHPSRVTVANMFVPVFNNRSDISILLVTHDDAEGLVVISKVQRKWLSAEDFPEMDANQICEDLKVAWGKKLLLISMWVTDDELQLFMMHPEFVCWDITSQPSWLSLARMEMGSCSLFAHAFIPSQKWWVFKVFFSFCVPKKCLIPKIQESI